jgi:cobalt-zinc-cadmium efflux system membrane fusion protein
MSFARVVPPFLVFLALGGIAFWGHRSGWKLPRFSALVGDDDDASEKDPAWCAEHNVPGACCVACNPALLPPAPDYGWCVRHGIPDCPLDHPDLAQVVGEPQLPRYDVEAALRRFPRQTNNPQCRLHRRRFQLASEEAARKIGLDVAVAEERPMAEAVAAPGEITYDAARLARLSSRVAGTVWRVEKRLGDPVRAGEALALIDAAEVGKTKVEFLQALELYRLRRANREALQKLAATGAAAERQLREADSAQSEARIRLLGTRQALTNLGLPVELERLERLPEPDVAAHVQFLGLPPELAATLDPNRATGNLIPVLAPHEGVVVAREAVAGEVVDATRVLFVVADLGRMTVTLNVALEDADRIAPGQKILFRPDASDADAAATVTGVGTAADPKTRTVKVRGDLPNPEGRWRDHVFGRGRVVLREEPHAVTVPREAVHWDGDCHVAFVRDRNYSPGDERALKVFHVRKVRTGARDDRQVEILAGVLPGEVVASRGSSVLLAELLRENIGPCCSGDDRLPARDRD